MEVANVTNSSRVLITRLSHLGDCILTLPLASAIRAHAPGAQIAWVTEKPAHHLLLDHPAIDNLIAIPSGFLKRPGNLLAIRRELRSFAPDICIDPQSLSKSAILASLCGAKIRVGFAKPIGREIAPLLNNRLVAPESRHLVDRTLELLQPLGIAIPERPDFGMPNFETAANEIRPFLEQHHLGCDFAIINPGAGWPSRRWPPRRFGTVARHLGQTHQIPSVVVWAGAEEQAMAHQIVQGSGGHGILAPSTSLQQLVELCRHAAFYVGSDTGPMHIAAAVGTPCVAAYGPTKPCHSGAYGMTHEHVQSFYQSTNRKTADEGMRAIEPAQVIEACDKMVRKLDRKSSAA